MRSATFGPTPGVRATAALSRSAIALASSDGGSVPEHGQRDLGADALHGLQQAKPFALVIAAEAEQLDLILAHIGLDRQHRGLAGRGQRLQRARGAMHLIADAADVEDHVILAVGIDQAFQLADHAPATFSRSADAAAVMRMGDGDRQRIGRIGRFRIGLRQQDLQHHRDLVLVGVAGADHGLLHLVRRVFRHRDAEHRGRQHGDAARLAEFQRGDAVLVDKGLLDRGLRRPEVAEHGGKPLVDRQQPARQRQAVRRLHRAAADEDQPVALALDHAPAGAAQAGVDAENTDGMANRWSAMA